MAIDLLTGHQEYQDGHENEVAEVQNERGSRTRRDLGQPVNNAVTEHPDRTSSTSQECAPVPSILFSAEDEIGEQDGDRCGGQGHDPRCES